MQDGELDYAKAYRDMIAVLGNHRSIEAIVSDLKSELQSIKEVSFLVHAMRLIIELDNRATSPLYEHLQSPMRQSLYMIDVYYSIEDRDEEVELDEERWDRIAKLLNEVEMTYIVNIGFPNDGDFFHDERDAQVEVSMGTFMTYFGNAVLSYEEQTRDRIVRYFKSYDCYIKEKFGFTVDEALLFIKHVRNLNNEKLNEIFRPFADTYSFYASRPCFS